MNNKRFSFLIAALIACAVLAACGGGGGGGGTSALDVTLKGEDIKFDTTSLTATVGQTVNVTLQNAGVLEHSFIVDELNVRIEKVPAGQTGTASFTPSSAGTYTYYCDVPGHKEAGMTGTLTVNP